MSGHDQALMLLTTIGAILSIAALWNVRLQEKHEREAAAQRAGSKAHPAE